MITYKYKIHSKLLHCLCWLVEVWNLKGELIDEQEFPREYEADQFINDIYAH